MSDIVTITCYGETEQMERKKAIALYLEGMCACEGGERERYTNIYLELVSGKKVCKDIQD